MKETFTMSGINISDKSNNNINNVNNNYYYNNNGLYLSEDQFEIIFESIYTDFYASGQQRAYDVFDDVWPFFAALQNRNVNADNNNNNDNDGDRKNNIVIGAVSNADGKVN